MYVLDKAYLYIYILYMHIGGTYYTTCNATLFNVPLALRSEDQTKRFCLERALTTENICSQKQPTKQRPIASGRTKR